MQEIASDVTYEIDEDGVLISQDVAVHHEISDSEFDYVLVGSNPDTGSKMIAFGFHKDELPNMPLPKEDE